MVDFFLENRIANNGFKPFEMLFKASHCDDPELLKSFTGDFTNILGDIVRLHTHTCAHAHTHTRARGLIMCCFSLTPTTLQVPKMCSGDEVSCKLEVMTQGHCLEYNYDYPNGFAIGENPPSARTHTCFINSVETFSILKCSI